MRSHCGSLPHDVLTRGSQAAALLCFLGSLGGCGETNADVGPDAGPCWPEILPEEPSQQGKIDLGYVTPGTGGNSTVSLSGVSRLTVEAGPQGGHHFTFNVRATGIIPGDPGNTQSSQNPRTRLSVHSMGGNDLDRITCPTRLPYRTTPDGDFSLLRPYILVMDENLLDAVYGHDVLVVAEVIDAEGTYIREEYAVSVAERETIRGPHPCVSCHVLERFNEQVPTLFDGAY